VQIIYTLVFTLLFSILSPNIFAQSNCPLADSTNLPNEALVNNCSISELSLLPNERLITFPAYILIQLPLSRLSEFKNEDLIKIGQGTGNLISFLGKFTNARILTFDLSILSQLPLDRQKTFSCDIQIQLGLSCGEQPSPSQTSRPTLIPTTIPSSTAKPPPLSQPATITSILIDSRNIEPKIGASLKLNLSLSDFTKEVNSIIPILVSYSNGTSKTYFVNFKYQPIQTVSNEFLVDVIIHKSLTYRQDKVADWARNIINNYINNLFQEAGITKLLRVDQVIYNYDESTGCLPGGVEDPIYVTCRFSDGRIRIFLYEEGSGGKLLGTAADPTTAKVLEALPKTDLGVPDYYGKDLYADALTHEIGHLFTLPDYYSENVSAGNNEVVPLEITAYVQDIMLSHIKYSHFSSTSANFVNRVTTLPAGFGTPHWNAQYTPRQSILKITDDNKTPISNVKIEVFQQVIEARNGVIFRRIPNKVKFQGFTNSEGEFNLGDHDNMFGIPTRFDSGSSIFMRITNGDKIRYTAITRSYLNTLYFQEHIETAVINIPFSSLIIYEPSKTKTLSAPGQISPELSLSEQERQILEEHIKQDLPTPQPIPSQPTPTPTTQIGIYDLNSDGDVNTFDTSQFLEDWRSGIKKRDFNGDSVMNAMDYGLLKKEFIQ
jgi:hypothetical protein